jgi:hypothetical protein
VVSEAFIHGFRIDALARKINFHQL